MDNSEKVLLYEEIRHYGELVRSTNSSFENKYITTKVFEYFGNVWIVIMCNGKLITVAMI